MTLLPSTPTAAVLWLLAGTICQASWANTFKWSGRRAPLFYADFVAGLVASPLALAIVSGAIDGDPWRHLRAIAEASPGAVAAALVAGAIVTIAGLLFVASTEMVGLTVAAPVSGAVALAVGIVLGRLMAPMGRADVLTGACVLSLAVVWTTALTCANREALRSAKYQKPLVVASLSGAILASFPAFLARATTDAFALPPLAATVCLGAGAALCGLGANRYLMARPLLGPPLPAGALFDASAGQHGKGLLGGLLWSAGMAAVLVGTPQAGALAAFGMHHTAPIITALWGVTLWREFRGAPSRCVRYLGLTGALYLLAILVVVTTYRAAGR